MNYDSNNDGPAVPGYFHELDPVDDLTEQAEMLLDVSKPREALVLLNRALVLDAQAYRTHCLRACAYLLLEEYESALASAEAAIGTDPDEEWGHRVRAVVLGCAGRHQEAFQAALTAAECDPECAAVMNCMVYRARALGKDQVAKHWAQRLVDEYPDSADGHTALGILAMDQFEWRSAEKHLRNALRIDPTDQTNLNHLGGSLEMQERQDEAIVVYHQELRVNPRQSGTHNQLYELVEDRLRRPRVAWSVVFAVTALLLQAAFQVPPAVAWTAAALFGLVGYWGWTRSSMTAFPVSLEQFHAHYRRERLRERLRALPRGLGGALRGAWTMASVFVPILTGIVGPIALILLPIYWHTQGGANWFLYLVLVALTVGALAKTSPSGPRSASPGLPPSTMPFPPDPPTGGIPEDANLPLLPVSDLGAAWRPISGPVVPLQTLAYQPQSVVDSTLGSAHSVALLHPFASGLAGLYREYRAADGGVIQVRFLHDRAVAFSAVSPVGPGGGAGDALAYFFGIDHRKLVTDRLAGDRRTWFGVVGSITLPCVLVCKRYNRPAWEIPPHMPFNAAAVELAGGGWQGQRQRF